MEYREKQYRVMLGIDSQWKWSVDGIEGYTKSSKAPSHAAGVEAAERAIDKALTPKAALAPPGMKEMDETHR